MLRLFLILGLFLGVSAFVTLPGLALDSTTRKIEERARDIRQQLAELDGTLIEHLRSALDEFGDRSVDCVAGEERITLRECIETQEPDLITRTFTIAKANKDDGEPIGDLADTEERFALFTDEMNRANDLLARAGAKLYRGGFDVTPEMDQLRRDVIVYIERKQQRDLRAEQALMIAAVCVILIAIFSIIFLIIRRFK
ncbi:hypothetical protein LPB41_21805 [Thalassospira sp. MA62]|nr:hypothetical protein [Thalassospira sp. MA62]